MTGFKKSSVLRQSSSYNSLYLNPLNDNRSNSEGDDVPNPTNRRPLGGFCRDPTNIVSNNKENVLPNRNPPTVCKNAKENVVPLGDRSNKLDEKVSPSSVNSKNSRKVLKPSSLQQCMQMNEPDSTFGLKLWDSFDSENVNQAHMWDYSDSEAAPASSWSTLPNRSLLCRPLPVDIGRCTCVIVKESSSEELDGGSVYSLYTNEGKGRRDRKLAVAHHKRRNGRSEFFIAQNAKGLSCSSDDSFLGSITANFMGSKYHIWDQGCSRDSLKKQPKLLLAVVAFVPTITTCTGSYRTLMAWIPKHQSMQLKSTAQIQHINGLHKDWKVEKNKTHQLFSRVPQYNNFSRQYELDFRERGRAGLRIQRSAKNFQLTMEGISPTQVGRYMTAMLNSLECQLSKKMCHGKRKTINPPAWKGRKIKVCDGLQISINRLPSLLYMFGIH